jgi:hypothetical protein
MRDVRAGDRPHAFSNLTRTSDYFTIILGEMRRGSCGVCAPSPRTSRIVCAPGGSVRTTLTKQNRRLSALMRKFRNRGFGPPCLDQRPPTQPSKRQCLLYIGRPEPMQEAIATAKARPRSAAPLAIMSSGSVLRSGAHASRLLAGLTAGSKFENIGLVVIVVWHGWTPAIGNRAPKSVRLLLPTRQSWDTFGAQTMRCLSPGSPPAAFKIFDEIYSAPSLSFLHGCVGGFGTGCFVGNRPI